MKLNPGDSAPDFTLDTLDGSVSLSDVLARADKGVIIYFYPKAGTPGCTKEACDFRDSENSLRSAGYSVIGISSDPLDKLRKFVDKQDLNFPLASDPDHAVQQAYGAWGDKKLYGKTFLGSIRSTFVLNPDGTVKIAKYNVRATGHVARLRRELGIDE